MAWLSESVMTLDDFTRYLETWLRLHGDFVVTWLAKPVSARGH